MLSQGLKSALLKGALLALVACPVARASPVPPPRAGILVVGLGGNNGVTLAATLEAELTEEAVADELAVQAEALDVADAFEDVEVEDVSPPLVVRQTEAPTPSDVCADCCAHKKRRRSLRFGYYDACDGCDC